LAIESGRQTGRSKRSLLRNLRVKQQSAQHAVCRTGRMGPEGGL